MKKRRPQVSYDAYYETTFRLGCEDCPYARKVHVPATPNDVQIRPATLPIGFVVIETMRLQIGDEVREQTNKIFDVGLNKCPEVSQDCDRRDEIEEWYGRLATHDAVISAQFGLEDDTPS